MLFFGIGNSDVEVLFGSDADAGTKSKSKSKSKSKMRSESKHVERSNTATTKHGKAAKKAFRVCGTRDCSQKDFHEGLCDPDLPRNLSLEPAGAPMGAVAAGAGAGAGVGQATATPAAEVQQSAGAVDPLASLRLMSECSICMDIFIDAMMLNCGKSSRPRRLAGSIGKMNGGETPV